VIKNPNAQWEREVIIDVLMASVTFHNMIIENSVTIIQNHLDKIKILYSLKEVSHLYAFLIGTNAIEDVKKNKFRNDLIEHL
jgi:hypothetical protein